MQIVLLMSLVSSIQFKMTTTKKTTTDNHCQSTHIQNMKIQLCHLGTLQHDLENLN